MSVVRATIPENAANSMVMKIWYQQHRHYHQKEEGETVAHRVEGGHVAREHVNRDTVREEREGHVRVRMSPPGSILQTELLSALVHSVEEWMFPIVSRMS